MGTEVRIPPPSSRKYRTQTPQQRNNATQPPFANTHTHTRTKPHTAIQCRDTIKCKLYVQTLCNSPQNYPLYLTLSAQHIGAALGFLPLFASATFVPLHAQHVQHVAPYLLLGTHVHFPKPVLNGMPLRYTSVTITTGRPMTEPDTFCSQSHTVSRNIPPAIHTLRKASKAHALAENLLSIIHSRCPSTKSSHL